MLIEKLIDALFEIVVGLFGNVEVDVSMLDAFLDKIAEIIGVATYLLPMGTVGFIFGITYLLMNFRISISL